MESRTIQENLRRVETRIQAACDRAGRGREEVRLLLASKTVPPQNMRYTLDAGERLFGENKIQEALEKVAAFAHDPRPEWHFIGHLQTNKIKYVTRFARMVQSIDRLELAQKLNARLERNAQEPMDVLLQVNSSRESSKFGVAPENTLALAREVSRLPLLRVRGLMTIGLFSTDSAKTRPCFRMMRELRDSLLEAAIPNAKLETLSMGMSHDFEIAIEEGATLVRIGTAVFGNRALPDSYYWNES